MKRVLVVVFTVFNVFIVSGVFNVEKAFAQDHLEILNSDILYKNSYDARADVLVGNVKLKHDRTLLDCDSARYYKEEGSFNAYGQVKVRQADTLSLDCDTLLYDGMSRILHARGHVVVINRKKTLITHFLDYDRNTGIATYSSGGTLRDGSTTLTSNYGEHSSHSNEAEFIGDVHILSEKYDIISDRIRYNTETGLVTIVSPTNIKSEDGMYIYSEDGTYDMNGDRGTLLSGSYVEQNNRHIEGDSLVYDKTTGFNEAFRNVVVTDEVNKVTLTGHHCWYDETTGNAMATDSALVIDWSEPDTVYIHADSLKMFTYNLDTDSVTRVMHAYHKVRMYRQSVQAVCDSLVSIEADSCTYLYGQPIVWQDKDQITGEEIRIYNNDSTISWAHVIGQAMTVDRVDSVSYNQIAGREIMAYFQNGEIEHNEAHGNVRICYFLDEDDGRRIGMNYSESTDLSVFMKDRQVDKIWMPSTTGTMYPADKIPDENRYLEGFAWFDSIRPKDGGDVFRFEQKEEKYMLKKSIQRDVPLQKLSDIK